MSKPLAGPTSTRHGPSSPSAHRCPWSPGGCACVGSVCEPGPAGGVRWTSRCVPGPGASGVQHLCMCCAPSVDLLWRHVQASHVPVPTQEFYPSAAYGVKMSLKDHFVMNREIIERRTGDRLGDVKTQKQGKCRFRADGEAPSEPHMSSIYSGVTEAASSALAAPNFNQWNKTHFEPNLQFAASQSVKERC